jgi:hypothetical protein
MGIWIPQPEATGPAQSTKEEFSSQLICKVLLVLDVNEIMTPGVIGLPKGVLLEAISPNGAVLHATVEGTGLPFVRR